MSKHLIRDGNDEEGEENEAHPELIKLSAVKMGFASIGSLGRDRYEGEGSGSRINNEGRGWLQRVKLFELSHARREQLLKRTTVFF